MSAGFLYQNEMDNIEKNFNLISEYIKSIQDMLHNKTVKTKNNVAIVTDYNNSDCQFSIYIIRNEKTNCEN